LEADIMAAKKSTITHGPRRFDVQFENHGSIVLIRAVSDAGQTWLDENVGDNETQHFGGAIAAEPRYCGTILEGAISAGLSVRA
jgi:hypothetical protein